MISTQTLAARLAAGYCREKVLANMDATDQAMVLDAINDGVQEWFGAAPSRLKRTAAGALLRAPVTMTANIVSQAKGFTYIAPDGTFPAGGYQSEDELVGKTCVVSGDSIYNRLQSSSTLLRPYMGQGGDATITFFGDTVPFRRTQMMVGQRVSLGTGGIDSQLIYVDSNTWEYFTRTNAGGQTGQPRWYTVDSQAPMDGGPYSWHLRVWPLPAAAYTLTFDLELTANAFDMDSLKIAEPVPIPDEEFTSLIRLCAEYLVGKSIWSTSASPDIALAMAGAVRTRLRDRTRNSTGQQQNWHGTPIGY